MSVKRYPNLAREVQRVLHERRMTLRQAETETEVGYSTIYDMKEGKRPSAETIVRWARALCEDAAHWLLAAGFDEIADLVSMSATSGSSAESGREPHDEELPRELQEIHGLHGLALQKAALLPPGKARDAYIARLRADAQMNLELIAERLEREEGR